jgi:hypothetical protein
VFASSSRLSRSVFPPRSHLIAQQPADMQQLVLHYTPRCKQLPRPPRPFCHDYVLSRGSYPSRTSCPALWTTSLSSRHCLRPTCNPLVTHRTSRIGCLLLSRSTAQYEAPGAFSNAKLDAISPKRPRSPAHTLQNKYLAKDKCEIEAKLKAPQCYWDDKLIRQWN